MLSIPYPKCLGISISHTVFFTFWSICMYIMRYLGHTSCHLNIPVISEYTDTSQGCDYFKAPCRSSFLPTLDWSSETGFLHNSSTFHGGILQVVARNQKWGLHRIVTFLWADLDLVSGGLAAVFVKVSVQGAGWFSKPEPEWVGGCKVR